MNYFERTITMMKLYGRTQIAWPSAQNASCWLSHIENELSPENLTCDGELPRREVLAKQRELLAAKKHCQLLIGAVDIAYADQFSVNRGYNLALRVARTAQRKEKLNDAVNAGFVVGAPVRLSNGVHGQIVKINRTRVKVRSTFDNRMWSVPPSCMTLAWKEGA
jgi:hypothetical protein